jgi:glycosyltransferase involved in cell wall biosynthesis
MKIANILLNYKKSSHNNKILGVERCFLDYSQNFSSLGYQVFSIVKNKIFFIDQIRQFSTKVIELPSFGKLDIFSIFKLAIFFKKTSPDLVICHSGRALFFSRIARVIARKKIPIITVDHGIRPQKFLKSDYVFTVNSYFNKELIKLGKKSETCFVVPNMIEIPKDFVELEKKTFRKPIQLGSLGRLYPEKNFDKVLLAMKILKDRGIECEYKIGGLGIMKDQLNQMAKELSLEKNFKIFDWITEKREFFDSIDIFILPSFGETFGIVLLEAMLYSTPIITSNSWGPDDVIDHEINGLKVSRNNCDQIAGLIANEIEKLNNDQNFAKLLTKNAKEKLLKNYSSDQVMAIIDQKIRNIINLT